MHSSSPSYPLLDPDDMGTERTPAQLFQWVEQKLEDFSDWHNEARLYLPRDEYYNAEDQLYANSLTKKLFEELRPLAGFVAIKWIFSEGVRIRPMLSNENYDAIVTLPNEGTVTVEITTTICGQQAMIQREHMRRHGYSPATHDIEYRGTKRKGYIFEETPSEAIETGELLMTEFYKIFERFKAKSKKRYPEGTWLLIAFDNYIGFHSRDHIEELRSLVELNIVPRPSPFSRIFLIGQSGSPLLEFVAKRSQEPFSEITGSSEKA